MTPPRPPRAIATAAPVALAPRPDHGHRDAAVAVGTYTTVRRRSAVPHEVFAAYWRDVHGPLCSRVPGLGWYVQHHFTREHDDHLWPVEGVPPLPGYALDGAVEIGFASADDQAVFQEASAVLFSDEQNIFDESVAYALPAGSTTLLDRQADPAPNGPDALDRLHVHLSARPGAADDLAALLREEAGPAFAASAEVAKVRLHAPDRYDDADPAPPAPRVDHLVAPERRSLVVLEVAFPDALARRRFQGSDAFAAAAGRLPGLVSHATAFKTTGVHVFVRDGRLTTAGLRGSRVAELITALAAQNQVSAPVRHLLATGSLLEG